MKNEALKIVFWGEDSFSSVVLQSLVDSGFYVQRVITPCYNNFIYKRLEQNCIRNDIPFWRCKNINSDEVRKDLTTLKPDLCVVAHFQKLIKSPLLSVPQLGFINLHPSLLPDYRGMAPQHWPIINGEKEVGVSIHYIDEGVDTGDIIIQKRFRLAPNMYVSDLQNKWLEIYRYIMVEAIERILANTPLIKQRNKPGSYYGRLKPEHCQISMESTKDEAFNLIKGVSMPYYGARYENTIIWRAHVPDDETEYILNRKYRNMGIYTDTDQGSFLRLKDGFLIIDKYKHF